MLKMFLKFILSALMLFAFATSTEAQIKKHGLINLKSQKATLVENKTIVLQFWASWCSSCGETMQTLNKITPAHKASFYGVSLDEDLSSIQSYIKAKPFVGKFKQKLLWDKNASFSESMGIQAVPTILVLNSSGKQLMKIEGKPEIEDLKKLRRILKKGV